MALKKLGVIEGYAPYFFQDLHAKVTTDLGGVRRLSVSGYMNSESLNNFDEAETMDLGMTWGNAAFSVHYRDRLGANGIIDANLGHSRFTSDVIALGGGGGRKEGDSIVNYTPPTDTLLFGGGTMGETRTGLRVTWQAGRATVTAGTQAIRFVTDQDHDVAGGWDDLENFFSPVTLRGSRWRLSAFSSVEIPLTRISHTHTKHRSPGDVKFMYAINLTRFPTEDRCPHTVSPFPWHFKGARGAG